MTIDELNELIAKNENENLEFKEAKNHFDFEELVKYCVAIANEGGGKIIFGVTDSIPRKIVGSQSFNSIERTKAGLFERLHIIRIDIEEINHQDGRVLVFNIPSRPMGIPLEYKGTYYMRVGESLVPMNPGKLKSIFTETKLDFSAEFCPQAMIWDLDDQAIENLRYLWMQKTNNKALQSLTPKQLLEDAELMVDGNITYAALIALGKKKSISKYLAQSEVIFEYRNDEISGPASQRLDFREGFLLYYDKLWDVINLRNDIQHYQDGFLIFDIPTFNEIVVREAILNAITHRDYQLSGNIFIRQFPQKLLVESPGGFVEGITTENILWKQSPRNRRLAELFYKCGYVERSGQGMNRMFEYSIKESKERPDFSGTDKYQVNVQLKGEVKDINFLKFLKKVQEQEDFSFDTIDLLLFDDIQKEKSISSNYREKLNKFIDMGILERYGRGKGTRYILSRKYYTFIGEKGKYTRKRGLDHHTNKELLLKHIRENVLDGSPLKDLMQVTPSLSRIKVQRLLKELKLDNKVYFKGTTRSARWYPI